MKTFTSIIIALFLTSNLIIAQDTIYVYKAGLVVSKRAVADIDSLSFTYTPLANGTVSDIDGNLYHWITIGTQKWMVENLKTTKFRSGEGISNVTDNTEWMSAIFGAWCDYDNLATNGTKYGKLYNWYAVNDSRKIAPSGWHIASDSEWTILENYLIENGGNYDGTFTGNKIAKALAATTEWITTIGVGTIGYDILLNNFSGFNALPIGYRGNNYGAFLYIDTQSDWWCSTASDANFAHYRFIVNGFSDERSSSCSKNYGFAVRCVKD